MQTPDQDPKRRSIKIGNRVYLNSFELTDAEEELKQNGEVIALKMKPYDATLHKNTVIFKSTPVEELFVHITNLVTAPSLARQPTSFEISEETWKVTYNVARGFETTVGSRPCKEQAIIQIEILDAGDRGNAVQFRRKAGSAEIFYQ